MTESNSDAYEFAAQEGLYTEQKYTIDMKMYHALIGWNKQTNPTEAIGGNLMNAAMRDKSRETGDGNRVYTGIVPVFSTLGRLVGNMDVTVTASATIISVVGSINGANISLCN
ncbi:hypothetical protein LPJ61_005742 [Coemansia biformis]|uniref:Uncharacterized protein n=1 Tax=Coemansia biformis TaxID=1286918 RepID=A0A9W7Y5M7_9FUNG|nr:hypothetical protein LPJ61_005742 [Coemansia biformis]